MAMMFDITSDWRGRVVGDQERHIAAVGSARKPVGVRWTVTRVPPPLKGPTC
jgi:hypothetical protein